MLHWLVPQPVGMPGLAALTLGALLFFALVLRMTFAPSQADGSGSRSGLSRLGIGLQMAGFACAGFGPMRIALPAASGLALAEASAVAALMGAAVLLFASASGAMGANWSLAARVRDDHALVTSGIFGRLRHPIYTGMALFLAALAVGLGHYANLIAALPLFALGTGLRVAEEERLLRGRFGAAYDAYAARVRRFVPRLF